jgi:hypothetical protein
LLSNGWEMHLFRNESTRKNRGILGNSIFYSVRFKVIQRGRQSWLQTNSRLGSRSNTSTVTLRVVGGDEKRGLESETVKYGDGHKGLGPEINSLARANSNCKRQTRPLVRKSVSNINKPGIV